MEGDPLGEAAHRVQTRRESGTPSVPSAGSHREPAMDHETLSQHWTAGGQYSKKKGASIREAPSRVPASIAGFFRQGPPTSTVTGWSPVTPTRSAMTYCTSSSSRHTP